MKGLRAETFKKRFRFKNMEFERIYQQVRRYTFLSEPKARELYAFVLEQRPRYIFEMGFYKGGSTLIMAAALDEIGSGAILSHDLKSALQLVPSADDLARRTGLAHFICFKYCDWCCEWELAKYLEANLEENVYSPYIDFVFLDGGHYWNATGFAFYLVSHLMRSGSWILFDDLKWDLNKDCDDNSWIGRFPSDARRRAMVGMVFDLLVSTHPEFTNIRKTQGGDWGWAQKR